MLWLLSTVGIFISMIVYMCIREHTLSVLISLEAMMLSLLVLLYSLSTQYLLLVLLTFAACEAALGLSLLVSMLRVRGSDSVGVLSSNQFSLRTWVFEGK